MKILLKFIFIFSFYTQLKTEHLRVISFNVNDKLRSIKKRSQIKRLLEKFNADIICVQEANQRHFAEAFAKTLKLNWNKNAWHMGGMTIITKHKIVDQKVIEIPNSYYNALVAVKIDIGIWIASIHLNSENYLVDDSERFKELTFILNYLKTLDSKNIILAGDFNSIHDCSIGKLLKSYNYIDTHENKPWQKSTWMPSLNFERIDRIHYLGNFKIKSGQVIDHNNISWLKKCGWPTGQDHRLVIADLIFQ